MVSLFMHNTFVHSVNSFIWECHLYMFVYMAKSFIESVTEHKHASVTAALCVDIHCYEF